MLDELMLKAIVRRNGDILEPTSLASAKIIQKFPTKPTGIYWDDRSLKHLRLLHGAIRNAFNNWPSDYRFQPDSPEHLRAWLTCKSGKRWRKTATDKIGDMEQGKIYKLIRNHMMTVGGYSFTSCGYDKVQTVSPISISFKSMSQKYFNDYSNDLSAVLIEVTNCSLDDFKMGRIKDDRR